jgi:hypothetical protein
VSAVDGVFPELGFRQRRVLKPLLTLFAMTGVLDDELLVPGYGASA